MSAIRVPFEKNRRYGTSLPVTPAVVMLKRPSALARLADVEPSERDRRAIEPASEVTCSFAEQLPEKCCDMLTVAVPVVAVEGTNGVNEPDSKPVAATV